MSAAAGDGAAFARGAPFAVFAYGSLMWDPGFASVDAAPALLIGFHRAFCIYSTEYRGTPERPGLVLGLDHGGSCRGVVYRVAADHAAATRAYLWEREMTHYAYTPRIVRVTTAQAGLSALAFTVRRAHPQYAAGLSDPERARIIARGVGRKGANSAYLANTIEHLRRLGIVDRGLARIAAAVGDLAREPGAPASG